jgi:putative Mg2+ transporter-C (MgtC) family protein
VIGSTTWKMPEKRSVARLTGPAYSAAMSAAPDLSNLLATPEVMLRLGAATLFGAAVGFDREMHNKPAGLRTQALVALGAATITLVTSELALIATEYDANAVSRAIQGVVTGIGFLGGGVILRDQTGQQVQGLTTAATIWVSAALGLACGAGLWRLALIPFVLTIAVLWLLHPVEDAIRRRHAAQQAAGK